jgi:hypothetical protein
MGQAGRPALPNRYLANYLVMTGAALGAQLKRNVEETVLAGQWAACLRLLRSRRLASGNEFGSPNTRWSRPRWAFRGRLGPGVSSDVLSSAARLLNIIVRRPKVHTGRSLRSGVEAFVCVKKALSGVGNDNEFEI